MFTLQIAIQQLAARYNISAAETQIIIRFGSLQTNILMMNSCGGKRIVLDINYEELYDMFKNYTFGLFFTNQNGRYFSILNMEGLVPEDKISGQEVYFYNDLQEIIYTAKLSLNFIQYKNPRIPNEQKIRNHKKLDDYFHKPQIPRQQVTSKTMTTFLYGGNKQQIGAKQKSLKKQKAKTQKLNPTSVKKVSKQYRCEPKQNIIINQVQCQIQDQDLNPPPMQFVNKMEDQTKSRKNLTQKLLQVNQTLDQKLKLGQQQKTLYSQNLIKTFNKFKSDSGQNNVLQKESQSQSKIKLYNTMGSTCINRNQLRDLAKKQIQNYQGKKNIQIPMFKNGKLELVQLKDLSQEQIVKYVQDQKKKQQAQKQKEFLRKLQEKQKQNKQLKNVLQKQKIKNKQNQMKIYAQKINNSKKSSLSSVKKYDQINQQPGYQQNSQKQKTEDYDYQSDFQSMSLGNSQIKSRISLSQKKPKQQEANYQQYEEDFQSFSQSQLNYSQKKSNSDISESWRSSLYKK